MDQQPTIVLNDQDDAIAWERFRQGSEASFTYLHKKHYSDLYQYALKMTSDEYTAKNAIQELFIYLWKNKTHLGEVQCIKYYLIFSLRRHVIRLLKKEQKHIHLSLAAAHTFDRFTFSPEDIVITNETSFINEQCVVGALNKLSARQREIIYLRYFHNLTPKEIAAALSLNYQSVLNCQERALKNLRKLILSRQAFEISLLTLLPFIFLLLFL